MISPDIIVKCKQRNQLAFKALYEVCLPYVFTIVKDYTKNQDFRKDLVQEVFAKAFLHIGSFDSKKGEFRFWLRKIAVNQCLMFVRDKKRQFDYEDLENSAPANSLREYIDLGRLDPDVSEQLISKMPNGYRRVFSLVVFEGYSHNEVGQKLGISAETSRSQLTRSKEWLRNYILNNKNLINNESF